MLELHVYYDDILRYTIISNWEKVQELRNEGFYVQVREIPSPKLGSGGWTYSPMTDGAELYPAAWYH